MPDKSSNEMEVNVPSMMALMADRDMVSALLQHMPDCLFIKNTSGQYLMVNQPMCELLGVDAPDKVIGKTDFAFLSPEKANSNRADERHIIETGSPILEKNEFIQNGRRAAWFTITKAPLHHVNGQVSGVIGIARDITEHILSEKRERATSQDLKAVVEIADRLISSTDLDTLLRKAVELARTLLRVERCTILLNYGDHLRGTYGTDLQGRTTDERDKIIPMDAAWEQRFRMWNRKSSQWIIERDIHRSSPDARAKPTSNFWVATTPIKGSQNRMIAAFCNDAVISGSPPDERLQEVIAVFCSLLGNIIERQHGMDELQVRDHVLEGVARSASQLLIVDDLDSAIRESLRILGESMDVDRVYLFKNHSDPLTGEWFMSQRYEWARHPDIAQMSNEELQDLPYQPVFTSMYETLVGGHIYGGPITSFSKIEREFLERQNIISILLVPIHISNQFWGFIGFDDCRRAREWSNYEKTTLMTMAGNLGGAITQAMIQRELKARDKILSGVAKANHELLTNPDLDDAIINALHILAAAVSIERIYLCENLLDPALNQPVMCPRFVFNKTTGVMSRLSGTEKHLRYDEHFPGWYKIMSAGRPIHGRLLDFLNRDTGDVRSVLLAPLMIEKRFWGIIGFDTPDPEYNWSESDVSTLATMAGSIGGAIARKRAEDSLRSSEEHFRTLIEHASDLILVVNDRGQILYGSPSVERALGYTVASLPALNFFALVHPDDWPSIQHVFTGSTASQLHFDMREFRVRHYLGEWLHLECAIKHMPDESGRSRYIINSRDITQRMKAEDALRQSEELFRHSQKMEAVGRLAGGISHDFNNLLTAILGYGDLLLGQIPDRHEWRKEVEEIHRAANRAHSLTRQLLAFSRRQVMEPRCLDLNTIVSEMEQLLKRIISENIILETSLDTKPCFVKVDRGQIEQVIINLAVNARDAMNEGGTLTIATRNENLSQPIVEGMTTIQPGAYVLLKVADTGHGIEEDIKPHIFEPFFTTKGVGKGTGLGLSMVYGTIEQSGGHILFDSTLNVGTEFTLYFPRVKEADPAPAEIKPASMSGGKETILLIEDDQIVRELSLRILKDKGYHVVTAENGATGLEYFTTHHHGIHLVLTDIIMPQMSGLAFARAARRIKPDIRILFMSGYSEDQQPELHETGEGRNYIQKPFTVATLCSRIREILDSPAGVVAGST